MHFTIRPVLWEHKKDASGRSPLKIAVTIDRKIAYLKTPYKLLPNEWDGKNITRYYENGIAANQQLRSRITEVEKMIIESNLDGRTLTAAQVKHLAEVAPRSSNFFHFVREVTKDTNLGHADDAAKLHQKEVNRLMAFAGAGLELSDINPVFLRKYEGHERRRGLSQNTLNTQFKWLRRMVTLAYRERIIKHNPFEDYSIPKYVPSDRVYLVEDELQALKDLYKKNLTPAYEKTLTYLLLGCYSGLRHSDWLTFDPDKSVEGGFVKLRPKKTSKKTGEWVVLPIGKSLREIIAKLRQIGGPPFAGQTCNDILKGIAGLAEINKAITTHTGRHTFGYLCASNGLTKTATAELLGVTEQTVEWYFHITGRNVAAQAKALAKI